MVTIRLATLADFDFFLSLKSEEFNIFWTAGEKAPDRENLYRFFSDAVAHAGEADKRKIYIIEDAAGHPVGHQYIIPNGDSFDCATAICQSECGKGYAREAIRLCLEEGKRLGFSRMEGHIREDNIASMKAYRSVGVKITDQYCNVYIPKLGKEVKMYAVVYDYDMTDTGR